ncbi:uncharacterized protein LOC135816063 [Sycon ciliatum]|uniref:uncharacterized protein LOC135816063 n=1 Tax=Sycon ciliatum TaxID=27933 RepID=UPI0031F709F4
MLRSLRKNPWLGITLAAGAVAASWLYRRYANHGRGENTEEENDVVDGDQPQDNDHSHSTSKSRESASESQEGHVETSHPPRDGTVQERAWSAHWFQMYRDAGQQGIPGQHPPPVTSDGGSWQLPVSTGDILQDPQPPTSSLNAGRGRLADPIVLNDYDPSPSLLPAEPTVTAATSSAGGFRLPPVPESVSAVRQQ